MNYKILEFYNKNCILFNIVIFVNSYIYYSKVLEKIILFEVERDGKRESRNVYKKRYYK